ncbi:MAG TPA: carbohydrate ABC transporter permease, partial [Devosia sp.]|nr:carbohydrate ABC transporter permease [Devosia sp.]
MNELARKRRLWGDILAFGLLLVGAICMIGPFVWMMSTSLKPVAQQYDLRLIPQTVTWENYPRLFDIMPFHLQLWNSFSIAAISTFGQLLTCSMAGFIFAVVRFPFRNLLFVLLLITLMVPAQITVIP